MQDPKQDPALKYRSVESLVRIKKNHSGNIERDGQKNGTGTQINCFSDPNWFRFHVYQDTAFYIKAYLDPDPDQRDKQDPDPHQRER
jgi:hypothetical protein